MSDWQSFRELTGLPNPVRLHRGDPRRERCLARFWANATEVRFLPQRQDVTTQWLDWLAEHRLGRKHLLDTLIAATWHVAGIRDVYTLNPADFGVFKQFTTYPQ